MKRKFRATCEQKANGIKWKKVRTVRQRTEIGDKKGQKEKKYCLKNNSQLQTKKKSYWFFLQTSGLQSNAKEIARDSTVRQNGIIERSDGKCILPNPPDREDKVDIATRAASEARGWSKRKLLGHAEGKIAHVENWPRKRPNVKREGRKTDKTHVREWDGGTDVRVIDARFKMDT